MILSCALASVFAFGGSFQSDVPRWVQWSKYIAPGIVYRQEIDRATPRVIHVLRFKYPSPGTSLKTAIARDVVFETTGKSKETISSIARRKNALAAINSGFFFQNGDPVGLLMSDFEIISEAYPNRSVAVWPRPGVTFDRPEFKGFLKSPNGIELKIDGVNRVARAGEIILFTERGNRAKTPTGAICLVFSTERRALPNKTIEIKFWQSVPYQEDMLVPRSRLLLVVEKSRVQEISPLLQMGDKWKLRLQLSGKTNWAKVGEGVGGGPRLVTNGKVDVQAQQEAFKPDFTMNRHPRTAIGTTAKGECVWAVVDGRQSVSAGATLQEMAQIMIRLGCKEAINLDGGGSSTFFLLGNVMNRPSDGSERPVSDAVLLSSSGVPKSDRPFRIELGSQRPASGRTVRLVAKFSDGHPVPQNEVVWHSSGSAGWVDQGGYLRCLGNGTVRVTAWRHSKLVSRDIEIR